MTPIDIIIASFFLVISGYGTICVLVPVKDTCHPWFASSSSFFISLSVARILIKSGDEKSSKKYVLNVPVVVGPLTTHAVSESTGEINMLYGLNVISSDSRPNNSLEMCSLQFTPPSVDLYTLPSPNPFHSGATEQQ